MVIYYTDDSHRYSGSADSGSLLYERTPAIVVAIADGDLLHRCIIIARQGISAPTEFPITTTRVR